MADSSGDQLKLWRERHRLKQREVADRIGATRGQYAHWENGVANIPRIFQERLAGIGFAPNMDDDPPIAGFPLMPRIRATPGQIRVLLDVLENPNMPEETRRTARLEIEKVLGLIETDDD